MRKLNVDNYKNEEENLKILLIKFDSLKRSKSEINFSDFLNYIENEINTEIKKRKSTSIERDFFIKTVQKAQINKIINFMLKDAQISPGKYLYNNNGKK